MKRDKYNLRVQEFPLREYWVAMRDACRRFCAGAIEGRCEKQSSRIDKQRATRLAAVKCRLMQRKYCNDQTEQMSPAASRQDDVISVTATPIPKRRSKQNSPIKAKRLVQATTESETRTSQERRRGNANTAHKFRFANLKSLVLNHSFVLLFFIFVSISSCQNHHAVIAQSYEPTFTVSQLDEQASSPSASRQQQQQQVPPKQAESSAQPAITAANGNAACFGGLQTFEKISMSTFESPAGAEGSGSSGASFGSGILIQQDDQALTSECINLCRSQSNCLSFVIDYNKFECKSYATTQQELQQEFVSKFQEARTAAANNNNNNSSQQADSAADPPNGGYQTAASSSQINIQQLLPSASSNYFEKICLDGVANRNQFSDVCGQGRLWTVERVFDSFLDGFVEKELTNVNNKDECSKLCIFETQFVCRSADYDQQARLCRLSKEDRRTQPQAMRYVANSQRQYLENQCATPGPSSCVYETKKNVGIISMDALKFAQTAQDCQMKCNQETTFNCRSYSFHQQRCFLSGDDSTSLNNNLIKLPTKQGWSFGEKRCLVELCTKGIFSYERITGFTLRSALSTSIDLMVPSAANTLPMMRLAGSATLDPLQQESSQNKLRHLLPSGYNPLNSSSLASAMMMLMSASSNAELAASGKQSGLDPMHESASSINGRRQSRGASNLAITEHCRHSCDLGYLNCPAFTVDYKNNRCQRLDRNSQGRHHELVAREGFAYYEKICLRVPEIMSMCQDKYWIFERVVGYELAPRLYDKSLKFVQSRRDCEEYCLEEKQFQCRSAMYNDETSDCKLSRYNRRLAIQEGSYYRNFNARISYLENNCVRDHELENNQCYYEQAREEPSYPTFTERIEMATPLPIAQAPPEASSQTGSRYNTSQHRYGAPFCEQLCNDNSNFECHSFGYYASTAQCFLSGDDSISAGEMATTPSTGFTYYEKKCRLMSGGGANQPSGSGSANMSEENDSRGIGTIITTPSSSLNPYFPAPQRTTTTTMSTSMGEIETTISSGTNSYTPSMSHNTTGFTTPHTTVDQHSDTNAGRPYGGSSPPTISSRHPGTMNNSASLEPDIYKCGVGHTYVYQRISGFEPIGGLLTLLVKNNDQPGIVAECADLCKRAFECRAFVVDYDDNQCFAMLENSSVGLLSLRQTMGKDYFEGFCLPDHLLLTGSNCRNKTWLVDKIVDQAVVGVQHQRLIPDSDRLQCRQACFEERFFWCKSAMFDSATGDCKLYSIDRESMPQMRLLFTKGVDFFENQCQITSSSCPYDAIERDITIITLTKSLQARSTFDCELSCNLETSFNCRSYTYLDQYPSLPNLCLLSSDSRSTSQRGSVKEHTKTLYAERNCYYRKPRYPSGSNAGGGGFSNSLGHKYDSVGGHSVPANVPLTPLLNSMDPYRIPTPNPVGLVPELIEPHSQMDKYAQPPPRISAEQEEQAPNALSPYDPSVGPSLGLGCEPHQFTFERTFGYDFKLAPKERASIAPTIGIAIGCQQECLRRGEKCHSFVVNYALPYQSCFLIETQAGANKKLLVKSPNSVYFEKVCLPRLGLQEPPETLTHSIAGSAPPPIGSGGLHQMDATQSLDTSPSYGVPGQDLWSPQVPNQLPYYLQQQQLVQNYPSRACSKLWSFERFVNHNFTAPVDRVIDNSLNRAQCETQCLNEASFSCRAATYDYANKICRLFKNTRRTILSQLVDLEAPPNSGTPQSGLGAPNLADSHPGTALVINERPNNSDSIQTSASSLQSNSLGVDSSKRQGSARQMAASLQTAEPQNNAKNIDYLENTCTPEPSSCQYRQFYDQFSPYIDKVNQAVSLGDCQRQCDQERLFSCKSLNYDPITRKCMLVNEDLISLNRGSQQNSLLPKKSTIYSEKGNCEMISVQCNSQEMLVSINFDSPFRGRVMAKGNPEQCFLLGDGQTNVQFSIVFGPKCNSRQEGHNTFVNEVVIQQHPVIMTESDKTVRVMCAFEAPDQTITLKNPMSRDNKTGIDVGTPDTARTRNDKQHFNSVVSNKASPPSVLLRILDPNGRDASMINLGDDLMLKIQLQMDGGRNSALGIFARNLAARSSNGESLLLIDNDGCPVDPQVFPALEIDPKDGKSLISTFKAFRFPSSGLVNFEVQIRFCPERCQPVECQKSGQQSRSYGRRRRKRQANEDLQAFLESKRAPLLQSLSDGQQDLQAPMAALDSLSTVMKPGKAFEYVRKLMLPTVATSAPPSSTEANQRELFRDQDASANKDQPQITPDRQDQPVSEEFEGQSNPGVDESSTKMVASEEGFSNINPSQVQSDKASSGESPNQSHSSSVQQNSISLHVDERLVPQTDFANTRGMASHDRFPFATVGGQSHPVSTTDINSLPPQSIVSHQQARPTDYESNDNPSLNGGARKHPVNSNNYAEETTASVLPGVVTVSTPNDQREIDNGNSGGFHPIEPPLQRQQRPPLSPQINGKEMPLRFSILVGENQLPKNGRPNPDQPSVLVMNSTSMDLDHIVIPGKKGELDDGDQAGPANSIDITHLPNTTNYPQETVGYQSQAETAEASRHRLPGLVPSKRTASYEQTFDALPSNSISSEVHMNHNSPDELQNTHAPNPANTKTGNVSPSETSAAASHDCQIEAGKSRLGTIIWTGGIVIALNICLVIFSLVLYFRKVHLQQDHTIVSSNLDYVTNRSDGGGRWPSVILKSKNKLGTSLNAHEHFFCKLNGSRQTGAGLEHDFNWPNLSSSSSRSTVSSLASPVPSTSIRVNQMRPSLKSAPFDAHSTLRSGNFNSGNPKSALSMMDKNDHRDEYSARYTNNIDILHSE